MPFEFKCLQCRPINTWKGFTWNKSTCQIPMSMHCTCEVTWGRFLTLLSPSNVVGFLLINKNGGCEIQTWPSLHFYSFTQLSIKWCLSRDVIGTKHVYPVIIAWRRTMLQLRWSSKVRSTGLLVWDTFHNLMPPESIGQHTITYE